MKKLSVAIGLLTAILSLVSCTKEVNLRKARFQEMTFYADGIETKTVLNSDGSIFWAPGEKIDISHGGQSSVFTSNNTDVSPVVEFKGSFPDLVHDPDLYFYAVYPHSDKNEFRNNSVDIYLPGTQEALENSFSNKLFPSIARTKDNNLHFQNIVGGVKFSLSRDGVKRVIFKANNGEPLAGRMHVIFRESGEPVVSSLEENVYSVNLKAPEGSTLKSGPWYYIALLPIVIQDGFSMEFVAESWVGTYTSNNYQTIRRSSWGILNHGAAITPRRLLSVTSTPLDFGKVLIGESVVRPFAVTNNTDSNLRIAINPSMGFSISTDTVVEIEAGSTLSFDLTFTPQYERDYSGIVGVSFSDGHNLYVHVNAEGIQTQIVQPTPMDMGLSVKWASFNVGASRPEGYGSFFAWGETDPNKSDYSWESYKWSAGEYQDEMTKYCMEAENGYKGFTDNKKLLDPEDDAAHVKLGGKWRMPTMAEFEELLNPDNSIVEWEPSNGVDGIKVTSRKTGQTIFLPAAGGRNGTSHSGSGTYGRYWSSSLNEGGSYSAVYLYFKSDNAYTYNYHRYFGYPVRPVCE